MKCKRTENSQIQQGHQCVQDKIKESQQGFAKAVTVGAQNGSGKIVIKFYDKLCDTWEAHLPWSHYLLGWKPGAFILDESEQTTMAKGIESEKEGENAIEDDGSNQRDYLLANRKRAATKPDTIISS